jgi:hypothetical protein
LPIASKERFFFALAVKSVGEEAGRRGMREVWDIFSWVLSKVV